MFVFAKVKIILMVFILVGSSEHVVRAEPLQSVPPHRVPSTKSPPTKSPLYKASPPQSVTPPNFGEFVPLFVFAKVL